MFLRKVLKCTKSKWTELRGERVKSTIIIKYLNIPLSIIYRTSEQKINDTINQFNLIDIYRTIHKTITENTFFSSTHRVFIRKSHF